MSAVTDSPAHQRLDLIVGRFIVEHIGPLATLVA